MSIVKDTYNKKAVPALMEKFAYKSSMAVPKIEKVIINTGLGRLMASKGPTDQAKFMNDVISKDLAMITGQKPAPTKARKSIAGFKLRQGTITGAKTTLRGGRMYDFIDRLINVVLPRSRDFRGLGINSVDENGNLTIGIKEHIFFPEISIEQIKQAFGLEITIVTTANTKEEGVELFSQLGFPFQKQDGQEI
ncbi:MAG TPA: 50S ribosomal protein L5 [Candidatus Wildermuthbacteria bacterium]|nr:50S ribosomal protein L5 [Candidatus Wildermuthbacteria bacterium]